jgi:predicted DsbA family dithiol-disulfide isomerase
MKIEIWSDVMCPFCYIGKRRLEEALKDFPGKDEVEIEWKSFQLDPEMVSQPGKNVYQYLAERKGISVAESEQMHGQVIAMAESAGLHYRFDKAVIANSFDAHRLMQLAKTKGLGSEAEERIFSAYFTEGVNVAEHAELVRLGTEIGLDAEEARAVLDSGAFSAEVAADIREAQQIGVRGVPFFVFDRKYAVSGAQPAEAFFQTLVKAAE